MPSMRNLSVGVVALAALAAAACGDERSVTSEPVGALGFGINFARTATNLPRGTVTFPATLTATGAAPATDSVVLAAAATWCGPPTTRPPSSPSSRRSR